MASFPLSIPLFVALCSEGIGWGCQKHILHAKIDINTLTRPVGSNLSLVGLVGSLSLPIFTAHFLMCLHSVKNLAILILYWPKMQMTYTCGLGLHRGSCLQPGAWMGRSLSCRSWNWGRTKILEGRCLLRGAAIIAAWQLSSSSRSARAALRAACLPSGPRTCPPSPTSTFPTTWSQVGFLNFWLRIWWWFPGAGMTFLLSSEKASPSAMVSLFGFRSRIDIPCPAPYNMMWCPSIGAGGLTRQLCCMALSFFWAWTSIKRWKFTRGCIGKCR